mgnify:CR=1 FL=1
MSLGGSMATGSNVPIKMPLKHICSWYARSSLVIDTHEYRSFIHFFEIIYPHSPTALIHCTVYETVTTQKLLCCYNFYPTHFLEWYTPVRITKSIYCLSFDGINSYILKTFPYWLTSWLCNWIWTNTGYKLAEHRL